MGIMVREARWEVGVGRVEMGRAGTAMGSSAGDFWILKRHMVFCGFTLDRAKDEGCFWGGGGGLGFGVCVLSTLFEYVDCSSLRGWVRG